MLPLSSVTVRYWVGGGESAELERSEADALLVEGDGALLLELW